MSEIKARRKHDLPIEEARAAAEKIAARMKKDFDFDFHWERHVLHFARSGVKGELHVTKDEVRLDAKLGLLLAWLKPKIEAEIDESFDKYFAPQGHASSLAKAAGAAAAKKSEAKKKKG
ncbi:MAG: polyhydroxyalkanoic acid system family protein [Burkholderiales bacterium]|jgi:putative polyhydroxyalkanoate system protein|nr:polyhydroxyalkanoic acid system family protein [Burkholderiales bacterium]